MEYQLYNLVKQFSGLFLLVEEKEQLYILISKFQGLNTNSSYSSKSIASINKFVYRDMPVLCLYALIYLFVEIRY